MLELFPVTAAAAVFGDHGPDLPRHYSFRMCAERPGPIPTTLGTEIVVPDGLAALDDAGTVLIAGWTPGPHFSAELGDAVLAAHARGARIVAVSCAVYIPARLGLLDGRRASVHWECTDDLARRYPQLFADGSILYTDHGDVATAGATAATVDLCLAQVGREHGAGLAIRIARQLSAGPPRTGCQRQGPAPASPGPAPDSLAPLLDWVVANLDRPLTVRDMAARSGMSERTVTRHFLEQLGVPPGRWLLDQRIASTRALLEETDLPVETIATRVGLSSAVNLRRRFRNALATTPAAYRRMFRTRV
ncbi:AraC family transcriptional regulator [Actinoplanes sp. SE50]|nr:HTH-type transcriptional regulator glxA [Actinoplanes sp. SE50/110]ATO82218.1 AraC family transcriptional regulator [Actinoplanes sp. SE50]SLL99625.1 AraC family transcriptional regulator [Actinoplanes sp. SE50/110]